MINLFIQILQAPHLPTVESDLLILELGASHYTRLEIATDSQISTPFAKDIAKMAQEFMERAKAASDGNGKLVPATTNEIDSVLDRTQINSVALNADCLVDNFEVAFYHEVWLTFMTKAKRSNANNGFLSVVRCQYRCRNGDVKFINVNYGRRCRGHHLAFRKLHNVAQTEPKSCTDMQQRIVVQYGRSKAPSTINVSRL